ncbi:MAG: hypothetical protein HC892_07460 [Saprospiraceae bacterium]|nr:hypothetical protein [Saprospiraceae bacterium]
MKNLMYLLTACLLGLGWNAQAQDKTAAELYNEGVEKLKAKSFQEALPLFVQSIELAEAQKEDTTAAKVLDLAKSNGAVAAYYLGNEQRKEKQFDAALATFEKGLTLNDLYTLYSGKAQTLDAMGKDVLAVEAYLVAGQKYEAAGQPDDKVIPLYKKAIVTMYKGKAWDKIIGAAQAHEKVLADADACYYVAKSYEAKSKFNEALGFAQKATAAAPQDEDLGKYYMLEGDLYSKLTKATQAIEAYKKVPAGSKYAERAQYNVKQLGGS